MKAILALEDGRYFTGSSLGAEGETFGEVVFNTSFTGYQEILTDPSYQGQIVTMTYTQMGNVGVNPEDVESRKPFLKGFIVKEYSHFHSNWRATGSLEDYLKEKGIVAIRGIDTRALTRHLRDRGAMRGAISTTAKSPEELIARVKQSRSMVGADLAAEVSIDKPYHWENKPGDLVYTYNPNSELRTPPFKVVAMDFGIKYNILRRLTHFGCDVTVVPASTPSADILALKPDGIFLSNGPGDPEAVTYAIKTVKELIGKKPVFGICLGHQILSLALGAQTFKLKFGHRGGNHPVKNLKTGRIEISSQNHGFAVDPDKLPSNVEVTHINLNDMTNEGIGHKELPVYSVQYHPEASPGPHDSDYLFQQFARMMKERS